MEPTFEPFAKIPRLSRDIVITEKIDGTNAQICIAPHGEVNSSDNTPSVAQSADGMLMFAGSRNRWIAPEKNRDNAGFAAWVAQNAEVLFRLGPGRHFGEWWGAGIQRRYGLTEKRFSLFNVSRYTKEKLAELNAGLPTPLFYAVPVLYEGPWFIPHVWGDDIQMIHPGAGAWSPDYELECLRTYGSSAAPGFMDPEGIVVFHAASGHLFKQTLKNDALPKSLAA